MDSLHGQGKLIEAMKNNVDVNDSAEAKTVNNSAVSNKEEEYKLHGSSSQKKKNYKNKEKKKIECHKEMMKKKKKKKKNAKIDYLTSSSCSSDSDSESYEDFLEMKKKLKKKKKEGKSRWLNMQNKSNWIWLGALGGLLLVIGGAVMVMRKPKTDVRAQNQQRDGLTFTGILEKEY